MAIHLIVDFSSISDKQRLFDTLKMLKKVPHVVEVKQVRKKRSVPQLRYYRGCVLQHLSNVTGFTPEEMDHIVKLKFLPVDKVLKHTGETITVPGSTGDLDTKETEEFYEQVRIWALQELDCRIPLPNEIID